MRIPLTLTSRSTYCEWKGASSYYSVKDPAGKQVENRIWSYNKPTSGFKDIAGYLSFYSEPWECYVDGEKVEPQPGDYYGGWLTSDILREKVKGGPGTLGW